MVFRKISKFNPASSVSYFLYSRVWQIVSFSVNLVLITTVFRPVEQGFYYAFLNFIAYMTLAEFGFNFLLTQFMSHEWVNVQVVDGCVHAPERTKARLASLLRVASIWTSFMIAASILLIGVGGWIFFRTSPNATTLTWQMPWALLVLAISTNLVVYTLRAILEGMDLMHLSQRAAFIATALSCIVLWIAMTCGLGLYSLALSQACVSVVLLALYVPPLLPVLRLRGTKAAGHDVISWWRDVWPVQWKIGVSWIANLIINQSFVPFIFHYQGAIEGGRVGILIQAYSFANMAGQAWLQTSMPKLAQLWARGEVDDLRRSAGRIVLKSTAFTFAIGAAALIAVALVKTALPFYGQRIGDLSALAFLMASCVAFQTINVFSYAVRANKREPFIWQNIAFAMLIAINNFMLSRVSSTMMFAGFLAVILLVIIPWVYSIWRRETRLPSSDAMGLA